MSNPSIHGIPNCDQLGMLVEQTAIAPRAS
jgi:hypothetical protein